MIDHLNVLMTQICWHLCFFYRYLMVYKPVNATGARSLKIFPSFAINFLAMKPEMETMVNGYY